MVIMVMPTEFLRIRVLFYPPVDTIAIAHKTDVVLLMAHRLQRWPNNIKTTLYQHLMFAGNIFGLIMSHSKILRNSAHLLIKLVIDLAIYLYINYKDVSLVTTWMSKLQINYF